MMNPDKKGETCIEFVNRIWGKCTVEEADALLWICTAYPCASIPHIMVCNMVSPPMYLGCQDHNIILAGGLTFFMTDYMVTYILIPMLNFLISPM